MDTISNFLNQLKTSAAVNKELIAVDYSGLKLNILKVLKDSGYIIDFQPDNNKKTISIQLKKNNFSHVKRISKSGQRIYTKASRIPKPISGYGLVIVSTPQGVKSGKEAKKLGIGGEVICEIW